MLSLRNVSKSYGTLRALSSLDLDVASGEILGLLGPNGAGKSTLIALIAGLIPADSGSICVDGLDIRSNSMRVRKILGVAPQELGIYPPLSVMQNLRYFGRLCGISRGRLDEKLERVTDALDLAGLLDRRAHELSGGEKRRLHTAMAFVQDTNLLLLDEPTAGVDVRTRSRLLHFIRELANAGTAICYATHYLQEIETLGASIAILNGGHLAHRGTTSDIVKSVTDTFIEVSLAEAIPDTVTLDGRIDGDDGVLRLSAPDPEAAITHLFTRLGPYASQVRSIEIVRPSLESAYLAVVGQRAEEYRT